MSEVTSLDLPVVGGALCLDFVNTIDPRHREPRMEYLGSYAELVRWSEFIGIVDPERARVLEAAGRSDPKSAGRVHARTIALRDALYLALAPTRRQELGGALAVLTEEWHTATSHMGLEPASDGYRRVWDNRTELDRMLWPVAESAAQLLLATDLRRVGECEGDGCGWLFLDTSKAGRRRWCSMAVCGNRAKARRYRQRARGDR